MTPHKKDKQLIHSEASDDKACLHPSSGQNAQQHVSGKSPEEQNDLEPRMDLARKFMGENQEQLGALAGTSPNADPEFE